MHIKFLIVFLLTSFFTQAQEGEDWRIYKPANTDSVKHSEELKLKARRGDVGFKETGEIKLHQDKRIAILDSLKKENPSKMDGYRVQIFFGDKIKATEMRSDFLRQFPETGAYISYLAPNFRLRVGDFRSKLESEKFKYDIQNQFPGSYIVQDKINLPEM